MLVKKIMFVNDKADEKLSLFYKIFHEKSPSYLFQLLPTNNNVYVTTSSQSNTITSFKTRHNFFKDSLFPAVISECNSLI